MRAASMTQSSTRVRTTEKRLRPERGDGVDRREAAAPSESEWGWGPTSTRKMQTGTARMVFRLKAEAAE